MSPRKTINGMDELDILQAININALDGIDREKVAASLNYRGSAETAKGTAELHVSEVIDPLLEKLVDQIVAEKASKGFFRPDTENTESSLKQAYQTLLDQPQTTDSFFGFNEKTEFAAHEPAIKEMVEEISDAISRKVARLLAEHKYETGRGR